MWTRIGFKAHFGDLWGVPKSNGAGLCCKCALCHLASRKRKRALYARFFYLGNTNGVTTLSHFCQLFRFRVYFNLFWPISVRYFFEKKDRKYAVGELRVINFRPYSASRNIFEKLAWQFLGEYNFHSLRLYWQLSSKCLFRSGS